MPKFRATGMAVLALAFALCACAPQETEGSSTVKVAGSTSVAPLMKALETAFEDAHPGIDIEIQESGSSAGISATLSGAADIGMSSRDLEADELQSGFTGAEIALDGIAIVVNKGNPVRDLTAAQAAAVFRGEIRSWSALGGRDEAIIVISREDGSGTKSAFEELLGLQTTVETNGKKLHGSDIYEKALYENSTGAIKQSVASSPNAIGYISLGTLDDSVAALSIDGVPASGAEIRAGRYALARPFLILHPDALSPSAQSFVDFMTAAEGQDIVEAEHYVRIDD